MNLRNLLKSNITPIFSIQDLVLNGEKVHHGQLSTFVKQRDLFRIKNGLFASNAKVLTKNHIAFKLLQPSYISLESALYEYGILPDVVFNVTSITLKNTKNFKTDFGTYIYKNMKKDLFFGYVKRYENLGRHEQSDQPYLIAEPEKALLDYLYLHKNILHTEDDIDSLRFNIQRIQELSSKKISEYARIFNNKKLNFLLSCLPLNK